MLLAALSAEDLQTLSPHLQVIECVRGENLFEPGSQLRHVYFPTSMIISLLYTNDVGVSTEMITVGNEGMLGISLLLGVTETQKSAVVQNRGQALRISGKTLQDLFDTEHEARKLLLRYAQAQLRQACQMAICNLRHSIGQRLCRWLLMSLDRTQSPELLMTHEILATLLGVRREGVTEALSKLQNAGLISCRRGHITVIDRTGIEAACCECYGILRHCFDLVMSPGLKAPPLVGRPQNTPQWPAPHPPQYR